MRPIYEVYSDPENVVVHPYQYKLKYFNSAFNTLDWVAYIKFTPTAPGLSLSRWVYLGQKKKMSKITQQVSIS